MSDKFEMALSLAMELSAAEKEQLLEQVTAALNQNVVGNQAKPRKLGLHEHLGEGWMSDDFHDELPDSFWLGQE
jgi:hypothetical protein